MNFIKVCIAYPLFALVMRLSCERTKILMDGQAWCEWKQLPFNIINMCHLFVAYREFRTLFYYRIGYLRFILEWLFPRLNSLYITTSRENVGGGLVIQHGFSTIISAAKIGRYCKIYQQVTIGYNHRLEAPVLGDYVEICCGAKVIGGVYLGEHSLVGANAVVVHDVPAYSVVAGIPAKIIKEK